jgi:hypothetical protein
MEVWKDVIGYEGAYQVSNYGNVKSIDRFVPSKYGKTRRVKGVKLKQRSDKDGYLYVNLKKNQKGRSSRVHRLVCEAFHDNHDNKPQVNHINGVKNDNNSENLEWVTMSENRQHAYDIGLQNGESRRGVKNNFAKLSNEDVLKIRSMYSGDLRGVKDKKGRLTCSDIAKNYKVSAATVQDIVKRKKWAWL